jgi:hypothetical protein
LGRYGLKIQRIIFGTHRCNYLLQILYQQIYSYLCKLSRELLSICLNRDCLSKARASWVFTFLLPLSKARGRLRAEKKKRIKSHLFQIISHESGIKA